MNEQPDQGRVKGMEARLFLFLVICLFPLLSVASSNRARACPRSDASKRANAAPGTA